MEGADGPDKLIVHRKPLRISGHTSSGETPAADATPQIKSSCEIAAQSTSCENFSKTCRFASKSFTVSASHVQYPSFVVTTPAKSKIAALIIYDFYHVTLLEATK